jgi:phytoene desaturase
MLKLRRGAPDAYRIGIPPVAQAAIRHTPPEKSRSNARPSTQRTLQRIHPMPATLPDNRSNGRVHGAPRNGGRAPLTPPAGSQVAVIGGGVGGLSAAIRLAAAGRKVVLFEQNRALGGKMAQVYAQGFRWDTGPSVITMRPVFEELFAAAGRRLDDYLTLQPVEPLTRYFYRDGTVIDASRDLARMAEQIARLEPHDVEGYLDFLTWAARLYRITGPTFIYDDPPSLRSLTRSNPLNLLKIAPWQTLDQAVSKRVRSPHLRKLLNRFATYVGANPFAAPATLGVIAHVELTGGVWYPKGGVYRIVQALEQLARELRVEIHTGTPVDKVMVENGRAAGVLLADGARVPAAAVIANVDVATAYDRLLPDAPALRKRRAQLAALEPSCSGFIMLLGVEGRDARLAHHNIFFADDYRREFDDMAAGRPPQDPTIYVSITSKSDPEHAPPGCENWFVLVNAPAASPARSAFDWVAQASAYRSRVFATLARAGFDVRGRIRTEKTFTPHDIEQMTGAWRGALYGISSNAALNAFRRPHNRCPDVQGLYFAGGSTHPGGGVPMVALSGKVAAGMVLEDARK